MISRKKLIWVIVCVVLYIGVFFAFTFIGNNYSEVPLPVMGGATHKVRLFKLTDQNGRTITYDSVSGKVYITNFFFTSCKDVCPKMNRNVQKIYHALHRFPDFMILSHTVNPSRDSVPVLKKYSEQWKANPHQWLFLTGSKKVLYHMARDVYLISAGNGNVVNAPDSGASDFIHTQILALIDRRGRIRGFYDGLKREAIRHCIHDARKLLEKHS